MMATTISIDAIELSCKDETGSTSFGADEISLGGYGVDANFVATKIAPFNVGSDFDKGEKKTYDPPRELVALSLAGNRPFPKSVSVGLLLFERDWGDGRQEMTQKAFELAQAEAEKQRAAAKADGGISRAHGAIGRAASSLDPMILIAEAALRAIVAASPDDMFPPVTLKQTVPSPQFSFDGSSVSPVLTVDFRGHGGVYSLRYRWRLS